MDLEEGGEVSARGSKLVEYLKKIIHENKQNCSIQLDNKLLNLGCVDSSITKYFKTISLASRLTNLGSKFFDENHVTYASVYVISLFRH
jgi:TPP-dependent 2-oxoacid decarboxylase